MGYTGSSSRDRKELAEHFRIHLSPPRNDIPTEETSYRYLVAQACASTGIMRVDFSNVLANQYGGLFSHGLPRGVQISDALPTLVEEVGKAGLTRLDPENTDRDEVNAQNEADFRDGAIEAGLSDEKTNQYWPWYKNCLMQPSQLIESLATVYPDIRRVMERPSGLHWRAVSLPVGQWVAHTSWVAS